MNIRERSVYQHIPVPTEYKFEVTAADSNFEHPLHASVPVAVAVVDVNDHPPRFRNAHAVHQVSAGDPVATGGRVQPGDTVPVYRVEVPSARNLRGATVGSVSAGDSDSGRNGRVSFDLANHREAFDVARSSGDLILRRPIQEGTRWPQFHSDF